VSDVEQSLRFYRDLLGMKVFYEQEIRAEASGKLLGIPNARFRLVSLQGSDSVKGMVGLIGLIEPPLEPRREARKLVDSPDVAFLFLTDGVQPLYERVKAAGFRIVAAPLEYEVPERGPISGFSCYDPDGVLVALMRLGPLSEDGAKATSIDSRRTTIMVSDMDESLSFYRDVLGMHVFYQQEITSAGEGEMLGVPGARVRVASLQSQGSVEGMVGLLAFQSPELRPRQAIMKKLTTPDVVLVFMTEDMASLYARVQERGVRIQSPPVEYEIPERGTSVGMSFYDPNGVLIELTQFGPLKRPAQ